MFLMQRYKKSMTLATKSLGLFELICDYPYVGLSTDFFVEEADEWRDEAWRIIRQRPDIVFRLLTKRAHRIKDCLPKDWGDGYGEGQRDRFR